jgi:hypothetical protein
MADTPLSDYKLPAFLSQVTSQAYIKQDYTHNSHVIICDISPTTENLFH